MDKEKEMMETPTEEPKKVGFKDRVSKLYPDVAMETEDEIDAAYNRFADDKERELDDMKSLLQVVEDQMSADDDLRAVITDMMVNKTPFRAAIAKFLSADDLTPLPTDDDYDAVRAAYNERLEKGKARDAQMEQINKNEEETYETFEKFVADHQMTPEQAQELNDTIGEYFSNLLFKKITPDMLEMFRKASDYDNAVANADREGEIRGRNAAIEAKRVAAEKDRGDGIPNLVGGGMGPERENENGRVSFLGKKRNNI